jgi:hypothetical protein
VPALARRHGDAGRCPGGAAGHSVDSRRARHERDRGRAADRAAARHLGVCRRSRLAPDCAPGCDADPHRRARRHRTSRRRARRRAGCLAALSRHDADGLRHRGHAAGAAHAGARMASPPHRSRYRRVHQRHHGRGRARSGADHCRGPAAGRSKLAARSRAVGVARAGDRADPLSVRPAQPSPRRARHPAWRRAGGRTGRTRRSGCSASPLAATTRCSTGSTPSCRIISPASAAAISPARPWGC